MQFPGVLQHGSRFTGRAALYTRRAQAACSRGAASLLHAVAADACNLSTSTTRFLPAPGKDATEDFEEIGHSRAAKEMLGKYYIGEFAVRGWEAARAACGGWSAVGARVAPPPPLHRTARCALPLRAQSSPILLLLRRAARPPRRQPSGRQPPPRCLAAAPCRPSSRRCCPSSSCWRQCTTCRCVGACLLLVL